MSSEAEARKAVEEAARFIEWDGAYPLAQALDDYRTQIEQRVLAQQPCYLLYEPFYREVISTDTCVDRNRACEKKGHGTAYWGVCPTCTARQTQETSG